MIVIAEAGVNHNGSLKRALEMVDAAKEAGADYIKFQTFKADRLVTAESATAEYQQNNCRATSQLEMLRALELSFEAFRKLAAYCRERRIGFLSTPFDETSIDFLASLGMDYMKVPSGEITNLPYLRRVAATGIPAIISTGMSTMKEIEEALNVFYRAGYDPSALTLLHCTTEYPAPLQDVNLRAMVTLGKEFGLKYGYSDHTKGIEVPLGATALGASVIEKHFTLSRYLPGPDHVASLEPDELREMIIGIHRIGFALGDGVKRVTPSESKNIPIARKSIVASRPIRRGEVFSEENLTVKRPGTGLSPMLWDSLLGTPSPKDFLQDELIIL